MRKRTLITILVILAIVIVLALELYGLNWVFKDTPEDQGLETSVLIMM